MLGLSVGLIFALRNLLIHIFSIHFPFIHPILMYIWYPFRYLILIFQFLKFLWKFGFKCKIGRFRNSRNSSMVDVVLGHLGMNSMHGWTAWELGLSQLCLARTEQALLGPFSASQSWLVIQKSHRNRAVLRFYRIGHISWDGSNEFNLDRWMRVDGFVWVNIDQFVHETSYLKPKLWWLMYWFCDILLCCDIFGLRS